MVDKSYVKRFGLNPGLTGKPIRRDYTGMSSAIKRDCGVYFLHRLVTRRLRVFFALDDKPHRIPFRNYICP
jgi:hypothetical protein